MLLVARAGFPPTKIEHHHQGAMRLATRFYTKNNRLYVPTTLKRVVGASQIFEARGGQFSPEKSRRFRAGVDEPSPTELFETIDEAYVSDKEKVEATGVGMGEQDEGVVFGGHLGEPLLRLDDVLEAARMVKEVRHGVPLILSTTGIVGGKDGDAILSKVPEMLESGVETVHLFLPSANPKTFPMLGEAVNFGISCVEGGISVKCLTVEGTGEESSVRDLASSLGFIDFEIKSKVGQRMNGR